MESREVIIDEIAEIIDKARLQAQGMMDYMPEEDSRDLAEFIYSLVRDDIRGKT